MNPKSIYSDTNRRLPPAKKRWMAEDLAAVSLWGKRVLYAFDPPGLKVFDPGLVGFFYE